MYQTGCKHPGGFAISWSNVDTLAEFPFSLAAKLLTVAVTVLNSSPFFPPATLGKRLSQTKTCNPLCPEGMVLFALAARTQLLLSHDYPPAKQCVPGEMKTGLCGVPAPSPRHYNSTYTYTAKFVLPICFHELFALFNESKHVQLGFFSFSHLLRVPSSILTDLMFLSLYACVCRCIRFTTKYK